MQVDVFGHVQVASEVAARCEIEQVVIADSTVEYMASAHLYSIAGFIRNSAGYRRMGYVEDGVLFQNSDVLVAFVGYYCCQPLWLLDRLGEYACEIRCA